MSAKSSDQDQYSEAETARRRDTLIRIMIATPPQKDEPMKVKRKRKRAPKNDSSVVTRLCIRLRFWCGGNVPFNDDAPVAYRKGSAGYP